MQIILLISIFLFGLWIDQNIAYGQILVNIIVWSLFFFLLKRSNPIERLSLLICVLYATIGGIILSLVWGLYEYRLYNLPLFVPPGHALLFTLGLLLSPKLSPNLVIFIPIIMAAYLIFSYLTMIDTMSIALFMVFLMCLIFGTAKKLYVTMFVLALILEVYGTTLGNWAWSETVPIVGLTTTNPPISAGVFYCLLDLLVIFTIDKMKKSYLTEVTQI